MKKNQIFSENLLNWYQKFGRKDLPWRKQISAYRVWLSEIMLQQTQVTTVLPYFEKFIKKFPTVTDLATADLDEILTLWAGLGYYARARNLHKCAQMISAELNGKFPQTIEELIKLPGVGLSTAGAMMSIAFKTPAPILDGNVKRILARQFCIPGYPGNAKTAKQFWQASESLLPKKQANDFTQAMMDLGALVCTKSKPKCEICPVNTNCQAFATHSISNYPEKKPKKILLTHEKLFLIVRCKQKILVEKRPAEGIWGSLFSLPEAPINTDVKLWCLQKFNIVPKYIEKLTSFKHSFTHFHLILDPILIEFAHLPKQLMQSNLSWQAINDLDKIGLPTPIKNILKQLKR